MDLRAELARFNPDPALADWLAGTVQTRLDQTQKDAAETLRTLRLRDEQLARRDSELHAAQTKIQALVLELAHLRRMRFGTRSETLSSEQRDLFQESLAADIAAAQAELAEREAEQPNAVATTPTVPRQRAGRQPLPEHLRRIEHIHEPESCTCGKCGGALVKIGEDISEQLDVEPAKFFVHRHIRPQYACRPCVSNRALIEPPNRGVAADLKPVQT